MVCFAVILLRRRNEQNFAHHFSMVFINIDHI
ncbi:Uncharacterised protein [Vibrio cholerae]|nr:Uncharacterised protein [Vibrio cholerae]